MQKKYSISLLSAVIAASVHGQVFAENVLEELVVTASKRSVSLQDTPLAISAFDQSTLVENHVSNIYDLRGMAPSLQIRSNGDHGVPLIFIRGQGTIDQTEAGDQAVAFYTDGVFAARSQGSTALMYDMERVEILRGPQGTLFGRNSTAGAISLITAKPTQDFEAKASLTFGSRERQEIRFSLNTPITDKWALRFAGVTDEQEGETKFSEGNQFASQEKYGTKDMSSFRVSSLFQPTDAIDWHLTYETFSNQGTGDVASVDGNNRVNNATAAGAIDLVSDNYRTRFDYTFKNDMVLSYIGGYTDMSQSQMHGNGAQGDTRNTVASSHTSTSHELQLKNSDDSRFRWTAGLFWFEEENDIRFDMLHGSWAFTPQDETTVLSSFQQPERSLESQSGYVQGTFDITEDWRITAGVRTTEDTRKDVGGRSIDCNYAHGPSAINVEYANMQAIVDSGARGCYYREINDMKGDWSNETYLARVEWDVNDDIMLFLSYATGWKSGVLQDGKPASLTNTNENPDIAFNSTKIQQPEENSSFELGIKSTLLDGAMTLNANLFLMDYTDMQVTSAVIDPVTQSSTLTKTNAGSATIQGLEFTVNYAVGEAGLLTLTGSFLDATYDDYDGKENNFGGDNGLLWNDCSQGLDSDPTNTCVNGLWDFSGNTLPNAPEVALNISYKHDFTLADGAILTPRIRLSYQDDTYLTYENRGDRPAGTLSPTDPGESDFDRQEAYTKVDASIRYVSADDKWNMELYVNNLSDAEIKQELFIGGEKSSYIWAPSREAGFRIGYQF